MKKTYEAVVLHNGWEMDNLAWVINNDGVLQAKTTSHGNQYTMDSEELDAKINETRLSLEGLIKIRELVYPQARSPKG